MIAFRRFLCAGLLGVAVPAQAAITIDFEDGAVGQLIDRTYAARGVVFANGFVNVYDAQRTSPPAHSGARLAHLFPGEFAAPPLTFTFLSGSFPNHVWFYGGSYGGPNARGTAKAFDQTGRLVAQDGPKQTTPNATSTLFDLKVSAPTIARVEFSVESAYAATPNNYSPSDTALDDLSFEGGAPPPAVRTPILTLLTPLNGALLDATTIVVKGTVQGPQLIPSVRLTTTPTSRPPKDLSPGVEADIPLTGAGPTRTFTYQLYVRPGSQAITITAQNVVGGRATRTVSIVNLPSAVRDSGGLGPLQSAWRGNSCTVAVYAKGALANTSGRISIGPNMLSKWLAWVTAKWPSTPDPSPFCPAGPEHGSAFTTTSQDFKGGRIYSDPARGTFYVPLVFAQTIDATGGEQATGVPLADPIASPAAKTWLFQQFARTGLNGLPSTLEIKGDPPTLWIERTGGDLVDLGRAGLAATAATATVAQSFSCAGDYGPCPITSTKDVGRVRSAGARCNFIASTNPEWVNVQPRGEYEPTLGIGWVHASHAADDDDAVTHEFIQERQGGHVWADWNVIIAPIGEYRRLLAANDELEIEFEEYPAHDFFIRYNAIPQVGDLYYAAGRWIIDCGHDSWSSEIHPPVATANVRTEYVNRPNGTQEPTTVARVWVNGYYLGGTSAEFLLYPPPRPAPNAHLQLNRPRNSDAARDVDMIDGTAADLFDPEHSSYVRVRFNASPRTAQFGDANTGMLKFQRGREYQGLWTLSWTIDLNYPLVQLGTTWWP